MILKPRNSKIELLRLFSMLLIVAGHYFSEDNWLCHTDSSLNHSWESCFHNSLIMFGQVGVCLFVLISAYFLSSNNKSPHIRLARLWAQVEIYSAGSLIVFLLLVHFDFLGSDFLSWISFKNVLTSFFPVLQGAYWFISAFFIMNVLSPTINKLFNSLDDQAVFKGTLLFLFVTFIWKFINPSNGYFNDVFYLCTVYVIGYDIRRYFHLIPQINIPAVIVSLVFSYLLVVLGTKFITSSIVVSSGMNYPSNLFIAGPGASPVFGLFAACPIFIFVIQQSLNKSKDESFISYNPVINHLATGTLGVYLIHENMFLKSLIWGFVFTGSEPASFFGKLVVSLFHIFAVFTICLIAALLINRFFVKPAERFLVARMKK